MPDRDNGTAFAYVVSVLQSPMIFFLCTPQEIYYMSSIPTVFFQLTRLLKSGKIPTLYYLAIHSQKLVYS